MMVRCGTKFEMVSFGHLEKGEGGGGTGKKVTKVMTRLKWGRGGSKSRFSMAPLMSELYPCIQLIMISE